MLFPKGFSDESALLKHECAYCLGQMQDVRAVPLLTAVLEDEDQDVMVRHEAGEALGAIGDLQSRAVLQKYATSPVPEIAETCQIALDRLRWLESKEQTEGQNPYCSVDPAPPTVSASLSTAELKSQLLDASLPMFNRYRALFSLRNCGDSASVEVSQYKWQIFSPPPPPTSSSTHHRKINIIFFLQAIVSGFQDKSALFRHEIGWKRLT